MSKEDLSWGKSIFEGDYSFVGYEIEWIWKKFGWYVGDKFIS